jgi:2,4-dienoyl-CoA reductase-like NADH-dependent reductase (Old Yellow Enzyme family)/thioredoxin reductase
MNNFPHLFSPIKLGNVTLRNRIVAAPTGEYNLTAEGYFTPEAIAYFEVKAAGGAAAVTIGEGFVHTKTSKTRVVVPPLDDPGVFPSLARAARAVKSHGAIPSIELQHAGKAGGVGKSLADRVRWGPSSDRDADGSEVHEMPEDMILEIVDSFGKAAANLKRSGFEMVLIHGGHGWLIHQFLSPLDNKRKDKYGGKIENRARFALMVIDAIRKAVGPGFPIEFRMSGDEFREGGYHLEDGIKFAKLIDGKVDLIHVSAGHVRELFLRTHPMMFQEHGCNVYLATAIKEEVKTPVACVGAITDVEMMEDIVASGKADVVAVARALISDPYLPKKAAAGRTEEITPCIRCLNCMGSVWAVGTMVCSVNPRTGSEFENKFSAPPSAKRKRVLIAGGGPGGMQAAITASERGHQVILCEKSSSLGGAIKFAEHVPFLDDLHRFRKHLEYMVKKSGTVVLLNTEVTPEFVASQNPDALIAAVGATPIVPDIRGIRSKKVVIANDIHNAGVKIGDKVVIIGGGLVGCDEAVYLAQNGKDVTVVEMLDDVARDANRHLKMALGIEFRKYNVKVVTNTKGKAITDEGLLCEGPDGKEVLYKADTVICAVGQKALTSVVDKLRGTVTEFYDIGDCVKPQKVMEAVKAGYDAAMDL